METLRFNDWLAEHTAPKIGVVRSKPCFDQIAALDAAIRRLAATDPMIAVSRILRAYADGCPLPPMD